MVGRNFRFDSSASMTSGTVKPAIMTSDQNTAVSFPPKNKDAA